MSESIGQAAGVKESGWLLIAALVKNRPAGSARPIAIILGMMLLERFTVS